MSIPGAASPLFIGAAAGAAAAYQIDRSLRFNSADSAYLNRTPSSAGNRKTWTWSGWVKFTNFSTASRLFAAGADNDNRTIIHYDSSNNKLKVFSTVGGTQKANLSTDAVFRDPSSFYHIVVSFDAANTNADIYINGVEQTLTASTSVANENHNVNNTVAHKIGQSVDGNVQADFYLAEVHFVDGTALAATDFGEYDSNNVWQPKAYTGTYGTNGFKLDFSDNTSTTTISEDSSGNNNDWTANNISVASGAGNDSLIDTPTNYEASSGNNGGNYATLNPLLKGSNVTLSNGNLDYTASTQTWTNKLAFSTIGVSSGKWYVEATCTAKTPSDSFFYVGVMGNVSENFVSPYTTTLGFYETGWGYFSDGDIYNNGSVIDSAPASIETGDVVGIALDVDNRTVTFYKNGTQQGSTATSLTADATWMFAVESFETSSIAYNFGQRAFAYTAPSGFKALCTTNLTDPTIADGSTAMDVALYTGNGSTQTISGLNFSPDLVWIKNRAAADNHKLLDTVRGATNELESNTTDAEVANADGLTAFNSDGFDLGADVEYNTSSETYVAWTWDAGTSTVSNTDGSITSSVRASQTNGFSIVTYTGDSPNVVTVGHGLNAAPDMIIIKGRSRAVEWPVYHSALGNTKTLYLNQTDGQLDGHWNNTTPTSSVFTLGDSSYVNFNDDLYVAYCFAPVAGYSAFGSYTGNGSTDGPLVYTGFRPRWVLFKNASGSFAWHLYDTARDTFNLCDARLRPDSSAVEDADNQIDILSNGFKPRTSGNGSNQSGSTFIYAAFAEHPFKYSRAR